MIVMHLQCCNCYALSNVMVFLHFQCGAHSTKFSIKFQYLTMMNDRKFGLCLDCLFVTISPLKVIMLSNTNGTLKNVHSTNKE
jgi:hypothetical protein